MASFKSIPIEQFIANLAAKQPTPGGGAAAAVGAAIGSAAASMSAAYTQRKKDKESGAAAKAEGIAVWVQSDSMQTTNHDSTELTRGVHFNCSL